MKSKDALLTPREAAQRLGITLQFVYMELWANRIPGARRAGRRWQIPEAAIVRREKKMADLSQVDLLTDEEVRDDPKV